MYLSSQCLNMNTGNRCVDLSKCLQDKCWRTASELKSMHISEKRNRVIYELNNRDNEQGLGEMTNEALARRCLADGSGSRCITLPRCLEDKCWKTAAEIRQMDEDSVRAAVVAELKIRDNSPRLPFLSDQKLAQRCLLNGGGSRCRDLTHCLEHR